MLYSSDVQLTALNQVELLELSCFAAAVGLWDLVPVFNIYRGYPNLLLSALKSRSNMCRGAVDCLLKERCLVPLLLEDNGQWLFDYITDKCNTFDTMILKVCRMYKHVFIYYSFVGKKFILFLYYLQCLCLWLNPLQDQLRPVMRDLKQGITSIYVS